MSDSAFQIEPASPVGGAAPVSPVRPERPVTGPAAHRPEPDGHAVAARTGGNLRAAYAQFVINPDTQDMVIRIRDATTDAVLSESPSKEIQAMSAYLKSYTEALARHRAANVQRDLSS